MFSLIFLSAGTAQTQLSDRLVPSGLFFNSPETIRAEKRVVEITIDLNLHHPILRTLTNSLKRHHLEQLRHDKRLGVLSILNGEGPQISLLRYA